MTKPERELCDCLSCVLMGKPSVPRVDDFGALLGMARHHAVTPLLADLPPQCLAGADRRLRLQVASLSILLEEKARQTNRIIARMARMLEAEGISYYLLKGQNCAVRYPHPERRQIGDIDLYVSPCHFERAAALFLEEGFRETESTMLHLSMTDGRGTELELHHDLQRLQWPGHDAALRRMCDAVQCAETIELDGQMVRVLPAELDIVVLCVHTMSHLYCAGLGLRHVCDYMMRMREALTEGLDIRRMEEMLKEVGAYNVYRALNHICNAHLHASLPLPASRRCGERVFAWMLRSGNFGHNVELGTGKVRFLRYYGRFLWHCVAFFSLSPLESVAWPVMKLKRAVRNEAHRKTK